MKLSTEAIAIFLRRFPFESGRWRLISTPLAKCKAEVQESSIRVVRTRDGFRKRVDVSEWLGRHIYVTGEYEPATTALIRATLKPGDVFVDVGANAGYFSLLAARVVGDHGKVFSFEPVPVVRDQLQGNLALNRFGNCRVFDFAVSNEEGEIEMFVGPANHRRGLVSAPACGRERDDPCSVKKTRRRTGWTITSRFGQDPRGRCRVSRA